MKGQIQGWYGAVRTQPSSSMLKIPARNTVWASPPQWCAV